MMLEFLKIVILAFAFEVERVEMSGGISGARKGPGSDGLTDYLKAS